jgi:uncharacterized cupredoxin-like copper-binding protein
MKIVAAVGIAMLLNGGSSVANWAEAAPTGQTVSVKMTDNAYSAKTLRVKAGTPVSFVFVNKGKLLHEATIGTKAEQLAHDKEMAAMAGMVMGDEPNAISVKAGTSKTIKYTFAKPGTFEIGCHVPGHYKAGMKITVVVS